MKRSSWRKNLVALALAGATVVSMTACSHEESRQAAASARCGEASGTEGPSTITVSDGSIPTPSTALAGFGAAEDCTYTGPGGFSLDLKRCPEDWDSSAGITDEEIRLFTSMPHAGNLAAYGAIGDGISSYLRYVNENGGIYGRQVSYEIMDDQLQPDITRSNVNGAIQSGEYAAGMAILGSSGNLAIQELTNSECMPQLLSAAANDPLNDPQNFPWTTAFGLNYYNETAIWADWIEQNLPPGTTVAQIAGSNAQGQAYLDGFAHATEGTGVQVVATESHEVTATNVDNQVTSAAATGADVVIIAEAGTLCTAAFAALERSAWDPVVIAANSCAQVDTVFAPLQEQGLTGNGTQVVRYYYAPTDADNVNTEFADLYTRVVTEHGLDPTNAQIANGWWWGWYFTQVLLDAGQLEGGLNRANITIAAHSYDSTYPLEIEGVRGKVSGLEDAYPFEAGGMYRYDGASADQLGTFTPVGPLIDNQGELKNWTTIQAS
jgi:branched-chain amino acid transport system substrate-binding protein